MAKRNVQTSTVGQLNKISSVINPDDYRSPFKRPEDILNRPLVLYSFEGQRGQMGNYSLIEALDIRDNEPITISSGAKPLMAALEDIQAIGGFPVICCIKPIGRSYYFDDCPLPPNVNMQDLLAPTMPEQEPYNPPNE